ncbi:TetR/AcrR family transcriptional regulator [Pseudophaeobacter arcticus]|uniref:TetR/AcrR family transcriptional regulator n=1 Tax=Pseudophaeobacter arcticus TaxID=385492 RepID=UPI000484CE0C|nr:TetR/AcrR family transcriptional regulator [Pseudophaeobacter arcticus]
MTTQTDSTRDHILTTGRALVAQRGFTGMGLAELLKTAAVPKGSFYHYFASKEDFGCKLLEQYIGQYGKTLTEILEDSAPTARARLLEYWSRWVSSQSSQEASSQCLIVKLGAEVSDISEEMRRLLEAGTRTMTTQLASTIAEGQQDGSIATSVQPALVGPALYQMWLGASLMAKLSRSPNPLLQAMEATLVLLPEPHPEQTSPDT